MKNNEKIQVEACQYICLKALLLIDKICTKYNINYFLDAGTLLGSVRNCSFIPWDDDVDILMYRSDYIRFKEVCADYLKEDGFFLQNYHSDKNYTWFLPRVVYLDSTLDKEVALLPKAKNGVALDIFILDFVPDNKFKHRVFVFIIYILNGMSKKNINTKIYEKYPKKIMVLGTYLLGLLLPVSMLHKLYNRVVRLVDTKSNSVGILNHGYAYISKKYDANLFSSSTKVVFEGFKFPIPFGYKEYLNKLYGEDWRSLPPKTCRHASVVKSLFVQSGKKIWKF